MGVAEATIRINDEAMKRFMDTVSVRILRKAVLRGNDCALRLVLDNVQQIMDAQEPEFMKPRRAKGLMKDYFKMVRRLRARFDGSTSKAEARAGRAALALEFGGKYDQWVHTYEQMRTTQKGGQTLSMRRVKVREHLRTRTEEPAAYLQQAMDKTAPVMMVPTARAVEAVFEGKKVPHQRTLIKGLRGAA